MHANSDVFALILSVRSSRLIHRTNYHKRNEISLNSFSITRTHNSFPLTNTLFDFFLIFFFSDFYFTYAQQTKQNITE